MAFLSVFVYPLDCRRSLNKVNVITGFLTAAFVHAFRLWWALFRHHLPCCAKVLVSVLARIRAREVAVSADDFPSQNCDDVESDELWCCCRRGEDGRLMLYCDRKREGCCIWYHYDCLGLSLAKAQELGASNAPFICPQCSDIDNTTMSDTAPVLVAEQNSNFSDYLTIFKPYTDFLWNDSSGEEVCRFLILYMKKLFTGNQTSFCYLLGKLENLLFMNWPDCIKFC